MSAQTWRQANGSTANQVEFVLAVAEESLKAEVLVTSAQNGTARRAVAIGLDSTTAPATGVIFQEVKNGTAIAHGASLRIYPAAGHHEVVWLETSEAAGTTTWFGDDNGTTQQSGMNASIEG